MESGRNTQWILQSCCFLACVVALTVASVDNLPKYDSGIINPNPPPLACANQQQKGDSCRFVVIVSTLDGKVSALDMLNSGNLMWSMDGGSTPLLDASISNLEIMRDGAKTRLIPSLDGTLYQFDGKAIQALPFTADNLLSSSFKFTDDSTIVGGKESVKYGINPKTGQVYYVCSSSGCTKLNSNSAGSTLEDLDDMLVITRYTKTVRAVEMAGAEKWNFSVGEHEIIYVSSGSTLSHMTDDLNDGTTEEDEDAFIFTSPDTEMIEDEWMNFWFGSSSSDLEVKVIVPQGRVLAIDPSDPDNIMWQHKFDSAIANAWILRDGYISEINLFDESYNPALEINQITSPDSELPQAPLLYVGIHENQMYVQPSVKMYNDVQHQANMMSPNINAVEMPKVAWRPYLATAPSRTPLVYRQHKHQQQITYDGDQNEEHGLAIWHEEYPFDGGYYLFPDTTSINDGYPRLDNETEFIFYNINVTGSLWIWWKEVAIISILTSIAVHLVVTRCIVKHKLAQMKSQSESTNSNQSMMSAALSSTDSQQNSETQNAESHEFHSRYYTEFTEKLCLGKGGFGVVFEATNNMDDISYAIKRITLNNSETAKSRVMREVKALAMLDNSNIVRYYQAWFESPPPGWQEEKDRSLHDLSSTMASTKVSYTNMVSTMGNKASTKLKPRLTQVNENSGEESKCEADLTRLRENPLNPYGLKPEFNPLKPFGGECDWSRSASEQTDANIQRQGSTEPFSAHLFMGQSDSLSLESSYCSPQQEKEPCFAINCSSTESDSLTNVKGNNTCPFSRYKEQNENDKILCDDDDSLSIVFEDSGCAGKSKSSNKESVKEDSVGSGKTVSSLEQGDDSSSASLSQSPWKSNTGSMPPNGCEKLNSSVPERPSQLQLMGCSTHAIIMPSPTSKLYLYIQMQLCRRESLKDWLCSNTLNRDRLQLLDIFDQIVSAVDYIHDSGLMHRDLKPSNIFFSVDGLVKVGDFGLVTALEEQHQDMLSMENTSEFYRKHTDQVGTKLYMSPEQVKGEMYDHKVDIYSLGLIFFELFYPFVTQMERVKTLLDVRKFIFPKRFSTELPDECSLVRSLLNLDPTARPSTKEIQQNLLLKDFECARQLVSRVRTRTYSSHSSDDGTMP